MIIAGPCSVESKLQLEQTFKRIYKHIDIFRAGVWKARSSVSDYTGYGDNSLQWLNTLQSIYSVPVAVEVGTPRHVELALAHNINFVWIGARTTVNSFYVQEIAESLRGSDVEIWVKNPIYSDLKLWHGSINRMEHVGLTKIKAIHRGFYHENSTFYRNDPRWDLLKKFHKNRPDIPIICDPSHICGNRLHILETCKKAIEQDVNSFMIEAHVKPANALSDSLQQLNPLELIKLISCIT